MEFNSVSDELKFIAEQNEGKLSPTKVVKFAENPETKLHSRFIWDDTTAARLYRLEQARRLIRLELTIIENSGIDKPVRLYYSLEDDRNSEAGYRLITDIISDQSLTNKMLAQALKELITFQNKYKNLKELANVFNAINELHLQFKEEEVEA